MTNWDQGYCPTCGAGLVPDASFCGNCGTSFASSQARWPEADEPAPMTPAAAAPGRYGPGEHTAQADVGERREPQRRSRDHREADEPDNRRSTPLLLFTGLLILAVTVASSNLLSGSEDDDGQDDLGGAVPAAGLTEGQVLLQPAGTVPEGAFLDAPQFDQSRAEDAERQLDEVVHHVVTLPELEGAEEGTAASLSALTVGGTEPGTYAGHRRQGVCARSVLSDAVAAAGSDEGEGEGDNSEGEDGSEGEGGTAADLRTGADVYTELLEVDREGFGELLDGLTPVRLRFDTRVTQHTVTDDGGTVPVQTILQAGTGVLVDTTGVPRISCNGANPLTAPDDVADDLDDETALDAEAWAANLDQSWERFDPQRVVTVTAGAGDDAPDDLLIADIETTDLVERPLGTNGQRDLGPGDIVATLSWESSADLDLAVVDPNEALISTNTPEPENSRGRLAEDANVRCVDNMTGEESISWPGGDAPQGEYTLRVTGHAVGEGPADDDEMLYEADCGPDSANFRLTVRLYGQDTVVHEGSVTDTATEEYTVTLGSTPESSAPDPEPEPEDAPEDPGPDDT